MSSAKSLVEQIKAITQDPPADLTLRRELYDASRQLSATVEDRFDLLSRVINSPMLLVFPLIASNLGLFRLLSDSEKPLLVTELAKATSADAVLLGRVLRFLASQDLISEVADDTFGASDATRALNDPGFQGGMRHSFEAILPSLQATPRFLVDTKYANPDSVVASPFQVAHKTDLPAFVWATSRPDIMKEFNLFMSTIHKDQRTFLDVIHSEELLAAPSPDDVAFVDVGGGMGGQCELVRQALPVSKGKVVLQELPVTLEQATTVDGVEKMAFDFWKEQPLKGARAYYMRNILHDYPDKDCLTLLKNTKAVLGPKSVILVDEMIIPNKGADWRSTQLDMAMMVSFASMERTERQWHNLFEAAGLKIESAQTYRDASAQSIMVVKPI